MRELGNAAPMVLVVAAVVALVIVASTVNLGDYSGFLFTVFGVVFYFAAKKAADLKAAYGSITIRYDENGSTAVKRERAEAPAETGKPKLLMHAVYERAVLHGDFKLYDGDKLLVKNGIIPDDLLTVKSLLVSAKKGATIAYFGNTGARQISQRLRGFYPGNALLLFLTLSGKIRYFDASTTI